MAKTPVVKITFVGDSTQAQKSVKDLAASATQAEVKVEGFGKSFVKAGVAFGVGGAALGAVAKIVDGAKSAVIDYNKTLELAERQIFGLTKSHEETAAALAVARTEADKGRGTYAGLAASMAGLIPIAKQTGMTLQALTETAEILAAINPAEGITGATVALANAASGDLTSVIDRFNLNTKAIQKYRDQGVPNIEAVRKAMTDLGYDTKFMEEANKSATKQGEVFVDNLNRMAAAIGRPAFDAAAAKLGEWNKQLQTPAVQEWIKGMELTVKVVMDSMTSWEVWGQGIKGVLALAEQGVKDAIGGIVGAYNGVADKLKLPKLDMGWLDDWQKAITGRKDSVAEFVRKTWGDDFREIFATEGKKNQEEAKTQGAAVGTAYMRGVLSTLTGDQLGTLDDIGKVIADAFKGNDAGLNAAKGVIAQAIADIQQFGRISDGTFGASEGMLGEYVTTAGRAANTTLELTRALGAQAPEVMRLLGIYQQQVRAQDAAALASAQLVSAQDRLAESQRKAAEATQYLNTRVAQYQGVAARHAAEATAAVAAVQDQIAAAGREAEDRARAGAAALEELQSRTEANAAASQRAIDAAQSAQAAASEQRQRDSEIAQAAIRGETEAYLRQTDALTEQDRQLAEHYETIIGGERRAKDAADERLNGLNRAANKDDLDFLTRIRAARESGNTKEAAALQRQFDARKKIRGSEMEIARAQAAVAGDEFDAKSEAITKEEKKRDEANAKAETEAGKRLKEVQDQATAQAAADAAALKSAQDYQRQQAQNAQDRQRALQDEITAIQRRATITAAEDATRMAGAQAAATLGTAMRSAEVTHAQTMVDTAKTLAEQEERKAVATRQILDDEIKRIEALRQAGLLPTQGAPVTRPQNPVVGPNAAVDGGAALGASLRREWQQQVRGGAGRSA